MRRSEQVELTCLVMVTDAEGKLLLQDRVDPEWGGLCFPGGHVERGESVVRAAIREVWEETGLKVDHLSLRGIKQFPIEGGRYLVFLFRTEQFSGELHDSREGVMRWLHREELSGYRLCDKFSELLSVFDCDDQNEMFWSKENGQWKLELL